MAAIDAVYIFNLALGAIGNQTQVAAVDEPSLEAETCSLWYESVRDQVFRAAPWTTLKGAFRLPLYSTRDNSLPWQNTDPTPGWNYAYGVPSDMVYPRYLTSFNPFERAIQADNTQVIVTNDPTPILTYTRRIVDPGAWDVDLQQAVAFALGAHIANRLTGSTSKLQLAFSLANDKIMAARANLGNMMQWQPQTTPDWIQARGSAYDAPFQRFIFPSADFVVAGFNNVT